MSKHIFIGLAWPYANGRLHLGHLASSLGADILARYHRLKGDQVLFVSGTDAHGTPIIMSALEAEISPQQLVTKSHQAFIDIFAKLEFSFDCYTQTNTPHHAQVVADFWQVLEKKGFLIKKTEKLLYSPTWKRFLPDRLVEGTCPSCQFFPARGDQCDGCGRLLTGLELENPQVSSKVAHLVVGDQQLVVKETEHFYFKLTELESKLAAWVKESSSSWRSNATQFSLNFIEQGLHDRAVTRDLDWGVEVPVSGWSEKRIYVWFEAVLGYLSASKLWASEQGQPDKWQDFWSVDQKNNYHYYVHGKDNIPFHTIIWPGMLIAHQDLKLPDQIVSSEYLNLEGQKFSKSASRALWVDQLLELFDVELWRFFLTVQGPESGDTDFDWLKFQEVINTQLIATWGNLVNRVLSLSAKYFPEGLPPVPTDYTLGAELLAETKSAYQVVGQLIEAGKFKAAGQYILKLSQTANQFITQQEPWFKIKDSSQKSAVAADLRLLSEVIYNLANLWQPFLPQTIVKVSQFWGVDQPLNWNFVSLPEVVKVVRQDPLYQLVLELPGS